MPANPDRIILPADEPLVINRGEGLLPRWMARLVGLLALIGAFYLGLFIRPHLSTELIAKIPGIEVAVDESESHAQSKLVIDLMAEIEGLLADLESARNANDIRHRSQLIETIRGMLAEISTDQSLASESAEPKSTRPLETSQPVFNPIPPSLRFPAPQPDAPTEQ